MNETYSNMELNDKRIAVLLSGGVDSSVVVYELAQRGLHPDCFYIKIGPEEQEEWDCTSEEDLEMATAVARRFGCKLEVVDCHREYWDQVTRYTMDKVRAGFTPNPDVMCNRLIKFGAFHEKRGHEYDLIATGHYAQTEIDEQGRKWLTTSPDPVKDQTDFLAQIYDWQLKKALFPIGHYQKGEVRISTPTGGVLGGGGSFNYQNRHLEATMKKTIEYDGQEKALSLYWNVSQSLMEGTYQVSIFADGNMIGSRSFSFK